MIFSEETEKADKIKITVISMDQLTLLANGISKAGWVWETMIYHKKSNQRYFELREKLKKNR